MKNLILSTYYNNPHFIHHQASLLKLFVEDDYEFIVLNDADDNVKSILSGNLSVSEIEDECTKWNIKHLRTPQHIHKNICDGGLVPDLLPANHPTERHRANLNWLFKNFNSLGFNEYDRFMLLESDMFLKKPLNISNYIENFDIMGTWRNGLLKKESNNNWHPKAMNLTEIDAKWLSLQFLLINLKSVKNISDLDAGGFAGSDSGGSTHFFLKENPQYKVWFMSKWNDRDYQLDFISKKSTTCEDADFLHYRGGTNWDHNSVEYYYEKMYRAFNKFIPCYTIENQNIKQAIYSSDGEHCFTPGQQD